MHPRLLPKKLSDAQAALVLSDTATARSLLEMTASEVEAQSAKHIDPGAASDIVLELRELLVAIP